MELKYGFLLAAVTIFVVLPEGNCLQCYSCINKLEPKCGKTWELSDEEAKEYLVTCEGENAACKKIDTTDSINGMMLVTRSCWNTNTTVELDDEFYTCTTISDAGTACYCKGEQDGKPCNGQQPLLTNMSLFVSLISIVVCLFLQIL